MTLSTRAVLLSELLDRTSALLEVAREELDATRLALHLDRLRALIAALRVSHAQLVEELRQAGREPAAELVGRAISRLEESVDRVAKRSLRARVEPDEGQDP